jgi:16S rRNA (cytosine1402-N4)-methyltransferase
MRMNPSEGSSCYELLETIRREELEKILLEWGEERFYRRIAGAILDARASKQLPKTTQSLADLIVRAGPPPARHGRIHAATRSFQALRIMQQKLKTEEELHWHDIKK